MSRSRVFIIQNQHMLSRGTNTLVPKFDFSPAEEFGELCFLLGPGASPFRPDSVIPEMREKLEGFSERDHLLLVGNPCLIGWATAIAADMNDGVVNLLQWSGKDRRYISLRAALFELP